jgi:DNA-binding Xre family transcriptional regulator
LGPTMAKSSTKKRPGATASGEGEPDLKTIGGRLKWARLRRGLGSRELCVQAGLSEATASAIETGIRQNVTVDTIEDLSQALGVEPEWLAWGRGKRP